MDKKKVYVTLENGKVFQGYRFGAERDAIGEVVFTTGMVGYVETLTDPSNFGQIVVQTFPLIGNYGVARADAESEKAWLSAYIVREICDNPSNFRMETTLEAYMKEKGVVGVYGIDTRELTCILREQGAMFAAITDKKLSSAKLQALKQAKISGAVQAVAPTQTQVFGDENALYTVALWNFGAKSSTIKNLVEKGCRVISLPANTTAQEIMQTNADGVVLSNGPGDPKENGQAVEELKKLLGKKPVFGLGLGHQLLALATGADTQKHKCGHRGANQPVKNTADGRVYISAQNHGYEVKTSTIKTGKVSFVSVNDGSCEGIDYADLQAMSVQFAPECCDIGNDTNPIYEKFFAMMAKEKEHA